MYVHIAEGYGTLSYRRSTDRGSSFSAWQSLGSAANLAQLVATNLTGHPAVILPNGFRDDGTPVSLTFLGGLFEEAKLMAVAHAYQLATGFHRVHPAVPVNAPPK